MAGWYLMQGRDLSGPYSWDELRFLSDRQKVAAGDRVRQGSDGDWRPAESVPGLLGASTMSVVRAGRDAATARAGIPPRPSRGGSRDPMRAGEIASAPPVLLPAEGSARPRRPTTAMIMVWHAVFVVALLLVLLVGLLATGGKESVGTGAAAGTADAPIGQPSKPAPGENSPRLDNTGLAVPPPRVGPAAAAPAAAADTHSEHNARGGHSAAEGDSRVRWVNETYSTTVRYVKSKKVWEEVDNTTGRVNWVDQETARTAEYMELFSPDRKSEIRLRADLMEQNIDGKWQWVANGHWAAESADASNEESPVPAGVPQGQGDGSASASPPRAPPPTTAAVIMPLDDDDSAPGEGADGSAGAAGGRAEFFEIQGKGRRFVYVVDCSGSMAGAPFAKARAELVRSIEALKSGQSFFVIFFDGAEYPQFYPAASNGVLRATSANKARARAWIDGFAAPGGGTDPRAALLRALALGPDAIYLLSDGEFDPGVASQVRLRNRKRIAIHTISFMTREAEVLLQRIARENKGSYRFVP